jgi:hypothetical protein
MRKRLAAEAKRLREKVASLPPSKLRDETLRKARQAEMATKLDDWVNSPGLQPPE